MRLGFAVAAFLEPDVLLVDEVLAVGAANFQQRCLDRMRQVLAQGTTLVLVSHDLAAIEAMCTRGLWLDNGILTRDGPIRDVLAAYRRSIERYAEASAATEGVVRLTKIEANRTDGQAPTTHQPLQVDMVIESPEAQMGHVYLGVSEGAATPIFLVYNPAPLQMGLTSVRVVVDNLPLPRGRYYLWICVMDAENRDLLPWHPATWTDVSGPDLDRAPTAIVRLSPVLVGSTWWVDGELVV
jgi:hypothetical protein